MTRGELLIILLDIKTKLETLERIAADTRNFVERLKNSIDNDNPLAQVLDDADIDELITIYTPQYITFLTAIETAADTLGTDQFK